jgi:hypothetical protein
MSTIPLFANEIKEVYIECLDKGLSRESLEAKLIRDCLNTITELQDKLHRRNLQIKELKKTVGDLEIALTTMQSAYKGVKEEV